ncbi:proton-conducting transporter transmembrane domain-containing protein [Halovenus salina]|uniref:Proton-conducting transporter membrane subunit n=1 Tax=Halovenus salina TaxID=1510225 RepID=A0ABD5W1Z5_9EURY|nr:proton-conducting transporter membrane subunit [Halovenus salina]
MTEAVVTDIRPLAAVLVSAVAVVLILASHRYPNVRESWSVLAALTKFGIIASMVPGVLDGTEYRASLGEFVFGIEFSLRADALGMIFALLASFLWIFTAFYAAGYMRGLSEHNQTRFFAAFAASLSTAVGVAFAENLLTIFVFYELLSVATYPLVAHDETEEARTAGRKYLAYTFFGGGLLVLSGTALVFAMAGTTQFGETAAHLAEANTALARAAFGLLAAGFGVKAALMPVHSWLPDAMVAPTPVSGLLHAVAVVKSGVFGIARLVLEVYNPELVGDLGVGIVLAILAAVTLTVASIIALRADRLKRRLAYSTISQLSYIVLGLGLVGPAAVAGAGLENVIRGGLLHIPAHAFMKLTLFFCAGIIHVETHTDYISEMDGIGKRMPLTMTAFAVASAGMAGIPLVAGFVSKWFILIGAVEASQPVFAVVLLISGVLNIAYFWPIVYGAFFESHEDADAKPLVEGPFGGRFGRQAATDGGEEALPDGGEETDHDDEHGDHHGGPGPGGWDRVGWTGAEGSWAMLAPILVVATGAVVLGVVPFEAVFLDLIESVVEGVTA